MFAAKAPFRISFVGGGTDRLEFCRDELGAVFSATIDKHIYVVVKDVSPLFPFKYRIVTSDVQSCDTVDEIRNPILRECLRGFGPKEVAVFSDVPARTGLGSSSALAVAATAALRPTLSVAERAEVAYRIERDVLKRPVGRQDHYASAFGGCNVMTFCGAYVSIQPVSFRFEKQLSLFYTGVTRDSSDVLSKGLDRGALRALAALVPEAVNARTVEHFAEVLNESWRLKKATSPHVSTPEIDAMLATALDAGALGGKLLGAGAGGFLLLVGGDRARLRDSLDMTELPFSLGVSPVDTGSTLVDPGIDRR